jgi:hypothetical protein
MGFGLLLEYYGAIFSEATSSFAAVKAHTEIAVSPEDDIEH